MSVIAIIGAGQGMGLAIADTFGTKGFKVALVSRNPSKLEPLIQELTHKGIIAAAFQGDITDQVSITNGLSEIKKHFGKIDVLEFSPADHSLPMVTASAVTHENAQAQIDFYVKGAISVVNNVLPEMIERGSGTIIFTTGGSSITPNPMFGNIGPAAAWLRNWAHALHIELAPKGIQVGHIGISVWIGNQEGAGPEAIAPLYWELYSQPGQVEKEFSL